MSKKLVIKIISILLIVALILFLIILNKYKRYSGIMDIYSNISTSFDNGTIENIIVITNQEVTDIEKCAAEIIEHCIKNDFPSIKFSYDIKGYPCELHAKVYEKKEDVEKGKMLFEMKYTQPSDNNFKYNIKDNPEKFRLEISLK